MVPPTPPTMTVHPSRDLARSEGDDVTADSSSEEDSEEDSDMVFTLPNMILRVALLVGSWGRGIICIVIHLHVFVSSSHRIYVATVAS